MKKEELKKVLKPLIKECIKEVVFEEGVLSTLIKEVATGLGPTQIVESKTPIPTSTPDTPDFSRHAVELQEEAANAMAARRRKLEESMGGGFEGIFESTEPLSSGGSISSNSSTQSSPLSNYAPNDPGVDISGLMAIAGGHNWKKMI